MCCRCGCGCEPDHEEGHGRRFLTEAERIEKLKNYAEELKKELEAVQEHVRELSK